MINDNGDIIVRGQVNAMNVEKVMFWAAAPLPMVLSLWWWSSIP